MEEIEFDILPSGEIRFARSDSVETNELLMSFLEGIVDVKGLNEFFGVAKDISMLWGTESHCG